jgi:hypothetical protein
MKHTVTIRLASGDYMISVCFERHLTLEVLHLRPLLFHLSALPIVSVLPFIWQASCLCSFIYLPCLLSLLFHLSALPDCFCAVIYLAILSSLLFHISARPIVSGLPCLASTCLFYFIYLPSLLPIYALSFI